MNYRKEIDGLRAIAIISVILFHAGFKELKGGFVGVDIFFVISGFLMTSIILSEKEAGIFTLRRFYERRIRRIFPMLFFTMAICLIAAFYLLLPTDLISFANSAFYASVAISNILFAGTTKGYFDTSTDLIPLVHTWTLGVEEQFYMIIPLIFILLWKYGKRCIFHSLLLLAISSFVLTFIVVNPIHKFYLLQFRFWELAIGSVIAFIPKQKKSEVLALGGLILILVSIFCLRERFSNIAQLMLLPCIGTAMVILYSEGSIVSKILSLNPLRWIGLISYSAYLLHQPLFAFTKIDGLGIATKAQLTILSIITLVLAFFTWKFIENPFRDKKKISFKLIFIIIILFIVGFKVIAISVKHYDGFPQRMISDMPSNAFEWSASEKYGVDCHIFHDNATANTNPNFCQIGKNKTKPSYFLTGDSMSLALSSAFNKISASGMYASVGYQCPFVLSKDISIEDSKVPNGFKCATLPKAVFEYVKTHPSIKKIFIAGVWNYVKAEDLEYTVEQYLSLGVHVYLIQQPPILEVSPRMAYSRTKRIEKFYLSMQHYQKQQRGTFTKIKEKFKDNSKVTVILIEDLFCDATSCSFGTRNESYYADGAHLSLKGAELTKSRFEFYLKKER